MISKPEDAVPRRGYSHDKFDDVVPCVESEIVFTAAECAQIARAYSKAVLSRGDTSARMLNDGFEPEEADIWDDVFSTW